MSIIENPLDNEMKYDGACSVCHGDMRLCGVDCVFSMIFSDYLPTNKSKHPDCNHYWLHSPSGDFCVRCGDKRDEATP